MNTLQILKQARQLISDPENWWNGVMPCHKRLCAVLAIGQIVGNRSAEVSVVCEALGYGFIGEVIAYNDTHTHEEVLAIFDKAIASLEKPGVEICQSIIDNHKLIENEIAENKETINQYFMGVV